MYVRRGSVVRALDCQLTGPGFSPNTAILFIPPCLSSLSCINHLLARDSVESTILLLHICVEVGLQQRRHRKLTSSSACYFSSHADTIHSTWRQAYTGWTGQLLHTTEAPQVRISTNAISFSFHSVILGIYPNTLHNANLLTLVDDWVRCASIYFYFIKWPNKLTTTMANVLSVRA